MPRYRFGLQEEFRCVADVKLSIMEGEPLCLAYKTSTFAFFVPVYFRDDGYVLAVRGSPNDYYPLPEADALREVRSAGMLPDPFPSYSIPLTDYAFGYALELGIVVAAVSEGARRLFRNWRHASLERSLVPGGTSLRLENNTDRWLYEEATKLLAEGESLQQQAYGYDHLEQDKVSKAYYVLLTSRRLIVMRTRLGMGPLRENHGHTSYERADIERVVSDERHLCFMFKDGSVFDFFAEWSERKLSNQRRFLADVPRLCGAQPEAARSAEISV
jgi:hypothetical protein